jgi:2-amino-4-hydroxy-6-hydroxymethyldihydropteridine diphosphokinase
LGLGSNLGDRRQNIEKAVTLIGERVGVVICQSSLIETEPWGFDSENTFLNGVILVETALTPRQLLKVTQKIERDMGRRKMVNGQWSMVNGQWSMVNGRRVYADSIVDIDILLYDDLTVDEPDLKIPHPLMHERDFVMIPLEEVRDMMADG